jgi:predicted trehalose synthase
VNAFLEIVAQLVAAVQPDAWRELRYFPFPHLESPRGRFFDACLFRQNANGALGLLWISFEGTADLMTFPFRLARHCEDGDLISLSPWSLREASADAAFFEAWKLAMHNRTALLTEKGAQFRVRVVGGEPNLLALNVSSDRKSVLSRLEMMEAVRIFRKVSFESAHSLEVEILEYLNQQKIFLSFPRLIAVYEYLGKDSPVVNIAMSTEYIHNNGPLWHDFLARLQHARFPDIKNERSSREAWDDVLCTAENLGRLLGEFHRAMTHARDNPTLVPEFNAGENRRQWLEFVEADINFQSLQLEGVAHKFPKFAQTLLNLPNITEVLLSSIAKFEGLGLRICVHGRVHLGHILSGVKGLSLFDFGADAGEEFSNHKAHGLKRPSLTDLAALNLSLRYAWYMTDNVGYSPIIEEFFNQEEAGGKESTHSNRDEGNFLTASHRRLGDIENTVLRSYMSAIGEDSAAAELVPNAPGGFLALYDLLFFLRVLSECRRDFDVGNPRLKTSLRILEEFSHTIVSRGSL